MPSEQESLDGQEKPRTRTARQETLAQASAVARYARCAQAAQDATATPPDCSGGVDTRPRLQEGDEEAREKALEAGPRFFNRPFATGLV